MANKTKYPFSGMSIGESKMIEYDTAMNAAKAQRGCFNVARYTGFKFRTRVMDSILTVTRIS